jgi:type VI protein secretion system component VasK
MQQQHLPKWVIMDSWFEHHAPWLHRAITAVAAALGLASFTVDVNTVLAVFSIMWLATQLWRFWRYERPQLAHRNEEILRAREQRERMPESSQQPDRS